MKDKKKNENKKQKKKVIVITGKMLLIGVICIGSLGYLGTTTMQDYKEEKIKEKEIPYSQFLLDVEGKEIKEIKHSNAKSIMEVYKTDGTDYLTTNPDYEDFKKEMLAKGIDVSVLKNVSSKEVKDNLFSFISLFVSISILFMLKKYMSFSSEDYEVQNKDRGENIEELAGFKELKEEVALVIDSISNREEYIKRGIKPAKGLLLYGPTGVGKTKLARVIASQCDINFIAVSGSSFDEKFVGTGAARVRKLFEKARENAPCVLFIDEIDAIGASRKNSDRSYDVQSLNTLLEEMDGFESDGEILVIGATNRIDALDSALLRPGRFDRKIHIPNPAKEDRMEIAKYYLSMKNIKTEFDEEYIADMTEGMSGAQIENIVTEFVVETIRHNTDTATKDDFENALLRVQTGGYIVKSSKEKNPIIAYHEVGHALIANILEKKVRRVSIKGVSTGIGGYTLISSELDKIRSKAMIEKDIMILYAGRAAEQIFYGNTDDVTIGASSDIKEASKLIEQMVDHFGFMEDSFINLTGANINEKEKQEAMKKISKRLYNSTLYILGQNKESFTNMSEALLEKETLTEEEILSFL